MRAKRRKESHAGIDETGKTWAKPKQKLWAVIVAVADEREGYSIVRCCCADPTTFARSLRAQVCIYVSLITQLILESQYRQIAKLYKQHPL